VIDVLKQKNVLYAEDDIVTQRLYKGYFEHYFENVYLAENGQQAIDLYNEKKPDIIFLDINMPVLNGLDVCKEIRKNDSNTKIILLTTRSDKEALLQAVELGLTTYLEKPVSKVRLKQVLIKLAADFKKTGKTLIRQHNDNSYIWNSVTRELFCNSNLIHLTKNEKLLLELFISSHHEKVSNEQIYSYVWSDDLDKEFSELSIKALIKRLRNKLPPNSIINSYGLGYSFNKSTDSL